MITVPSTNYAPNAKTRAARTIHGAAEGAGWQPAEMSGRFHSTTEVEVSERPEDTLWTRLLEIGNLEIDISTGKNHAEQSESEGRMTAERFRQFYGDWHADQPVWVWWKAPKYEKGDPNSYLERVVSTLREMGITEIRPHIH